ncbi:MAG: class I SAM-dependent methyltransferase [Gammaproteobacteria bacterium]|nr:class I SAM-dependent methyltransferase [Gammaproteobacteria bacterium]
MSKYANDHAASDFSALEPYKISKDLKIPNYLEETYWWAYVHPNSIQIFERQWLVNFILWGNFARLRDVAINEAGITISGNNLQVACVYGDFSQQLSKRLDSESQLHIVDIAPIQLQNVYNKIKNNSNVFLHHQDSTSLKFEDESFDNIFVFFLLHEQPETVRAKTVEEVMRVVKPGGKVIFVDYHKPHWLNPLAYLMRPVLHLLEPYALAIWRKEIIDWVPPGLRPSHISKETLFGDLYQKVTMIR